MQVVAFACVLIWGVSNVFLTWANAITIGLVLMYILANIGVVKYYLTEAGPSSTRCCTWSCRWSPRRPASSWSGSRTSRRSPAAGWSSGACMVFIAILVMTIVALIYLRVTRP